MGVLVSVIVPIFNIEPYIEQCIKSICDQSYRNLEIILVDDGSVDRCGEIVDQYARKDERIISIHKKNGGLVSARKAGMKASTGKYVVYVDGDDWIEANYIEELLLVIERENADVVTSGYKNETGQAFDGIPTGIYDTNTNCGLICHICGIRFIAENCCVSFRTGFLMQSV